MRTSLLALPVLMLLAGCPVSPDAVPPQQPGGAPGGQPGGEAGGPQGPGGPGGEGVMVDFKTMTPQQDQDAVKAGEHYMASGTVAGECTGRVRIDVVSRSPGGGSGPLTATFIDGAGAFTLAVPKGTEGGLTALCDNNGDDKIRAEDDLVSTAYEIAAAQTEDLADITLTLGAAPQPGGPGGGPKGGPPAGGPGAGPGAGPQGGPGAGPQGGPPTMGQPPAGGAPQR